MKLLITDDHKLFIEGIRHLLHDEFRIEIAGIAYNGKEAIDICKKQKFDVALMDINMPVIDGIHATREIKRFQPAIKIIIVSMMGDFSSAVKALKAGADAYILKSEGTEELGNALRKVLRDEIYLSPSLAEFFTNDPSGKLIKKEGLIKFSENLITSREKEVLKLIAEGFTNDEIAAMLHISIRTADTHRTNLLTKLKVPNTAALVKAAIDNNLI